MTREHGGHYHLKLSLGNEAWTRQVSLVTDRGPMTVARTRGCRGRLSFLPAAGRMFTGHVNYSPRKVTFNLRLITTGQAPGYSTTLLLWYRINRSHYQLHYINIKGSSCLVVSVLDWRPRDHWFRSGLLHNLESLVVVLLYESPVLFILYVCNGGS